MTRACPRPSPPDKESPFASPWVFGRARQEALGEHFFGRLRPGSPLAVFYIKSGHPFGENVNRLVVGIGSVDNIAGRAGPGRAGLGWAGLGWVWVDGRPVFVKPPDPRLHELLRRVGEFQVAPEIDGRDAVQMQRAALQKVIELSQSLLDELG